MVCEKVKKLWEGGGWLKLLHVHVQVVRRVHLGATKTIKRCMETLGISSMDV